MNTINWRKSASVSALLCLAGLTVAPPSSAFDVQSASSDCIATLGDAGNFVSGGNVLTANTLVLSCPILDTASLYHKDITGIGAYYDDETSSGSVSAFRCVDYGNAVGGNCGNLASSSSSGTGVGSVGVPNTPASFASDWNNLLHFAYVVIYLPPKSSGGAISYLKGLYYYD